MQTSCGLCSLLLLGIPARHPCQLQTTYQVVALLKSTKIGRDVELPRVIIVYAFWVKHAFNNPRLIAVNFISGTNSLTNEQDY